jgi:hypothetical protein
MEVVMRIITALTMSVVLLTGACTGPDGRVDPGATLGLAAGLAAVGGLVYLATQNDGDRRRHAYHDGGGYRRGGPAHGGYRGGGRGYR